MLTNPHPPGKKPNGPPKPPPGSGNSANGGSANGGNNNGNTGVDNEGLVGVGVNTGANGDNGNGGKGGNGGIAGMQIVSELHCLHIFLLVFSLMPPVHSMAASMFLFAVLLCWAPIYNLSLNVYKSPQASATTSAMSLCRPPFARHPALSRELLLFHER